MHRTITSADLEEKDMHHFIVTDHFPEKREFMNKAEKMQVDCEVTDKSSGETLLYSFGQRIGQFSKRYISEINQKNEIVSQPA